MIAARASVFKFLQPGSEPAHFCTLFVGHFVHGRAKRLAFRAWRSFRSAISLTGFHGFWAFAAGGEKMSVCSNNIYPVITQVRIISFVLKDYVP